MKQLSALDKHCLANMPELLDAISSTCLKLERILDSINQDFQHELDLLSDEYRLFRESSKEDMSVLDNIAAPSIDILYNTYLTRRFQGKKTFGLHIWWGYECSEEYSEPNTIYFCCSETENSYGALTPQYIKQLLKKQPHEFRSEALDEDGLYIEFTPDTSLHEDKIKLCMQAFLTHTLKPILKKCLG